MIFGFSNECNTCFQSKNPRIIMRLIRKEYFLETLQCISSTFRVCDSVILYLIIHPYRYIYRYILYYNGKIGFPLSVYHCNHKNDELTQWNKMCILYRHYQRSIDNVVIGITKTFQY